MPTIPDYYIKLSDIDGDAVGILDDTYTTVILEILPVDPNFHSSGLVALTPKQARKLAVALIEKAMIVAAGTTAGEA